MLRLRLLSGPRTSWKMYLERGKQSELSRCVPNLPSLTVHTTHRVNSFCADETASAMAAWLLSSATRRSTVEGKKRGTSSKKTPLACGSCSSRGRGYAQMLSMSIQRMRA